MNSRMVQLSCNPLCGWRTQTAQRHIQMDMQLGRIPAAAGGHWQGGGSAPAAALVNFLVGTVALSLFLFVLRQPWPDRTQWESVPAWAWFGGLFGALYVATATFAGPRLGALLLLALTVAGQMVASIIVDHYGLLGFREQAVTAPRLIGVLFLVIAIYLIAR